MVSPQFTKLLEDARDLPRTDVALEHFVRKLYNEDIIGLSDKEIQIIHEAAHARRPRTLEQRAKTYNSHISVAEHAGKALGRYGVQPRIPGLLPDRRRRMPSPEIGGNGVSGAMDWNAASVVCWCHQPAQQASRLARRRFSWSLRSRSTGKASAISTWLRSRPMRASVNGWSGRLWLRVRELELIGVTYRRDGRVNTTNLITATPKWSLWLKRREAWKVIRQIAAADLRSNSKKEDKGEEKGCSRNKVASSVPSCQPVEPRREPVIVTDLRSDRQKAEDDARFARWREPIKNKTT